MRFDQAQLEAALDTVPERAWSTPSQWPDNHIHHHYSRASLVIAAQWLTTSEPWEAILDRFGDVHDAWLTKVDPGGYVVPHTDASRFHHRWQLPIRPAGITTQEDRSIPTVVGQPFRVEQWLPHAVWNFTPHTRIHLIVDLASCEERPAVPFRSLPVPEQYQDRINA